MSFDPNEYHAFKKSLMIDSKERNIISLGDNPLGTQVLLNRKIEAGFERGIREFVTLKCRQIGVSTESLAMDLYWINKYTGLNGALITHTDGARDQFRTTLQLYRAGLEQDWHQEVLEDNRSQLVLKNGSRLSFRVAGTKARSGGSSLGRSGALALAHMTEVAFYGDVQGIDSLRASFADHNPIRFYHWESTANGFNHFEQMWRDAKKSTSMSANFISWWANEFYRLADDSQAFQHYWGRSGRLTPEERMLRREVKTLYDEDIDDNQIAWYRYMAAEKLTDEMMLRQEFPWTEDMAFVATGDTFFRSLSITKAIKQVREKRQKSFRIETGSEFWELRVVECKASVATLQIWAEPSAQGEYVLGCDPSYGSSDTADNNVVSVWRVWYNRIEQVAEFADPSISTHACAWVMAYLAGYYGRCYTNLEVNGPGGQVLRELQNLRRLAASKIAQAEGVRKVLQYMKQYLYRKIDTFNRPSAVHTKTTHDIKERFMNAFRDYFERGIMVVRSHDLVEEMRTIVRDGGSAPAARSGKKDDRVVGAGLAVMCWDDQMRSSLLARNLIWAEDEQTGEAIEQPRNPVERLAQHYLASIGFGPAGNAPPPKKQAFRGKRTWRERTSLNRPAVNRR